SLPLRQCHTDFPYTTLFRSSRIGDAKKMNEIEQISQNPERILAGLIDKQGSFTLAGENTKFKLDGSEDDLALYFTKQQKEISKRSEEHTSELQSRENLVCRL